MTTTTSAETVAPPSGIELPPDADADFRGSLAAIRRAAATARQRAAQTGTDLIVERCGQMVRVSLQPTHTLP